MFFLSSYIFFSDYFLQVKKNFFFLGVVKIVASLNSSLVTLTFCFS